jgi:hypothetical protein
MLSFCLTTAVTGFSVNFEGAFVGEVSGNDNLEEQPSFFLATRLLSCGSGDVAEKFTGNEGCNRPENAISKVIHAFAHFSLGYSKGHLLLCDLQGLHHP